MTRTKTLCYDVIRKNKEVQEGENKMKEFKNFVPVEIKNHLELIIENIDNISEMKKENDVDFFMNETMRLIEMLKNDVESFAEFQKN